MHDQDARLTKFKLLKESIKSSGDYLIVGIDTSKRSHCASLMSSSGNFISKAFKFDNSSRGFEAVGDTIKRHCEQMGACEVICGVESTGNYHKPLAHYLEERGFNVVLVSTLAVRRNRETLDHSWDKSDRRDAANIADLVNQGKSIFYDFKEGIYAEVRRLLNLYHREARKKAALKTRLRNDILSVIFPELDRLLGDIEAPEILLLLRSYPLPSLIRKTSCDQFMRRMIASNSGNIRRGRLLKVYEAAGSSVGVETESASILLDLELLLDELEVAKERCRLLKLALGDTLKGHPHYKRLQSIPGVGPLVAATFISEIGNIHRYDNARQIVKLAGLDLAGVQSGGFQGKTKISKRGKCRLRSAAFIAALAAVRYDNPLRAKYLAMVERKAADPGAKMKSLMAIARKILRIAFSLMRNNKEYIKGHDFVEWRKYK